VTAYAEGLLEVGRDGAGRFKSVVLHPTVTVPAGSDVGRARTLHQSAHEKCFIANSVNFPVECEPEIVPAAIQRRSPPPGLGKEVPAPTSHARLANGRWTELC
jgi:hypothetical protein